MRTIDELGISNTPWTLDAWNDVNDYGGYTIASVMDSEGCDKEEESANARLIAAAPELYQSVCDLLEICSNIGECIGIDCGTIEKIDNAKKAIAKASGEEVAK